MKITYCRSLLYYDCELIFEAEDAVGRKYLAVHHDDYATGCEYAVVPVNRQELAQLKAGRLDLRSLMLAAPGGKWYTTKNDDDAEAFVLHDQPTPIAMCESLPDAGYYVAVNNPEDTEPGGDDYDAEPLPSAAAPRLIEKWLPINQLSTEAVRERAGAVPNPAPHQLHVWWARRPLAPSRATTLLSLLPQAADGDDTRQAVFDLLGASSDIHRIAQRLAHASATGARDKEGYGSRRRAFTHNPAPGELAWLKANRVGAGADPVVLDVTAGGGSIPFEAGRLGLRAIANELNPVACFILRATCQWPQQYGYALRDAYQDCAAAFQERVGELLAGVYPEEPAPDCAAGDCPHPQAVCAIPGCQHDTNKCSKIAHRDVRAHRYVWAYLWARTVECPPCRQVIPLSPNWRLDGKGTGIRVEPAADAIELHIVHDRSVCPDCRAGNRNCHLAARYPDRSVSAGTVTRAIAACPACGATTPKGYLAQEAQAGRMGHRLYCVIYRDSWRDRNKDGSASKRETTCRVFAAPAERHGASNEAADRELARLGPQWDAADILPTETVPIGNDQRPHTYGMEQWVKMFNPRQQLAHGYCVQAFRECVDDDAAAGRLDDCRRAAWGYVALALDKLISTNSLHCRWHPNRAVVAGTFDRHDFGFKWSYAEMAITCPGLGLDWSHKDIGDCLSAMIGMAGHTEAADQSPMAPAPAVAPPAEVIRGDARDLPQGDASVDCIVFDPPYEENVCYAELSDFFYVWLKRTAGYVFPEDFADYLTEKDQEAIASPARFRSRAGGKDQSVKARSVKTLALADYREKMAEIFAECRRVIKPDGIMTVMFNHKSTAAWDALTVALISAGFAVTRTWPVKTEAESSMHIKGKAAARTTILLVCRPRAANPFPRPWHEVKESIAGAVRDDIRDNLSQADLRPIDLYLSAFGPALRVISEHWGTERETANAERPAYPFLVTPTDALQVARREVSRHRALVISREWANNPADAATKFYILAKDASENDTLLFDEANLLARAMGVSLAKNDAALKGVVSFNGDKVALVSARDRLAGRSIGEDISAATVLDAVHTAVALTDRRNTLDARQWLTRWLHDPEDGRFRATLEALIRTTRPGHDDHQAQRNLWQALYSAEPPPPAGVQAALL